MTERAINSSSESLLSGVVCALRRRFMNWSDVSFYVMRKEEKRAKRLVRHHLLNPLKSPLRLSCCLPICLIKFMSTLPRIHVDYHFTSYCFWTLTRMSFYFFLFSLSALVAVIIHRRNVALEMRETVRWWCRNDLVWMRKAFPIIEFH